MKISKKLSICIITMICIGISLFSCDPMASQRVYLNVDMEQSSKDKIRLSIADNKNIQIALRLCDELFAKYGFAVQERNPSNDESDYLRWYENPTERFNPTAICISMNEDRNTLEVNIIDALRFHSTPLSIELSEKVYLLFADNFGDERVSKE